MTPAPRSSPAGCACRIRAWSSRSRSSATPAVRSGRPFRARLPLSLVSDQIHELGEQAVGRWGRYVWIALGATALAPVAALYPPFPPRRAYARVVDREVTPTTITLPTGAVERRR